MHEHSFTHVHMHMAHMLKYSYIAHELFFCSAENFLTVCDCGVCSFFLCVYVYLCVCICARVSVLLSGIAR